MVIDLFLAAAEAAEQLIASDDVADRWDEPSALEGYTVGGLAGHLARAVLTVATYLDRPQPPSVSDRTDAAGYVVTVLGAHDPIDSDFHRGVRSRAEQAAEPGPRALAERLREVRAQLGERLDTHVAARPIEVLDGVHLSVDDYLQTRLVELVVHLDDLAVSIDRHAPETIPEEAYELVAAVLARIAVRRVGGLTTVRSLARRERQPDAVRAL